MRVIKKLLFGLAALLLVIYVGLCVYAYWPSTPEVPARSLATADDRFIGVNGVQLRYRRYGTTAVGKPQLLLIHGFANSLQSWRLLAPLLAECCDVVAIDMPGYGLSDKPEQFDYHNGPQAALMVAAAHALGLTRPIYVGHSLGGAIALQAAVKDSAAAGLVLMNPGIISTGVPKIVQLTIPPLPRLSARQFGSRSFRERFLKNSYVHPQIITPAVIDAVMLGAHSAGYMTGMTSLMQQYSEGEEITLAPRVHVPVLIAWGNRDRNKPLSEADQLQRLLPGSKLVRFDDAGHYVHEEAPAGVAGAIQSWLAGMISGPPTLSDTMRQQATPTVAP